MNVPITYSPLRLRSAFSIARVLAPVLLVMGLPLAAQTTPNQTTPTQTTPTQTTPGQTTPGQTAPVPTPPASQLPDAPGAGVPAAPVFVPTGPTVVFDTSAGRLTCKLFSKESPLAAANFIGLAEGTKSFTDPATGQKVKGVHFYDGTTFHRVIPGFMIQGGDRRGDGTGDAGYYFNNEDTPGLTFNVAGRLAMANSGPNTNGTQFFITELPYPDLDGKYTIFGQCDAHSVLLVATIARVDRDAQDKPTTPVVINKVTIVNEDQPMPPEPSLPPSATPPVEKPAVGVPDPR
jgi:peptidyl-prolyl cis-trans isomerase A (cyclophilin A)